MIISTRSRPWLLTALMPILAIPVQAADVNKYLPNDADFVLVLNVKQLLESPLVQKHALADLKTMLKGNSEATKHFEAVGFDPFKDLNAVTVGICLAKEPKGLLIAQGSFDVAKFEQKASELAKSKPNELKIHKDGTRTIYEYKPEQGGEKPVFAGFVDKATIVASNEKQYVLDAFQGGRGGNLKKEVRDLIDKVDINQSLGFVVPGSSLLNSDAGNNPDAKKLLEKIESVTGGLAINRDVKMQIDFAAKGADAAKELADVLKGYLDQFKGLAALMASNQKELAPAVEVMEAMKVETAGSTVSIKAHASEDSLEKALKNK